jgi:outer membrane protein
MHETCPEIRNTDEQVMKISRRIIPYDHIELTITRIGIDDSIGYEGLGFAVHQNSMDVLFAGIFLFFGIEANDIALPFAQAQNIGTVQGDFFLEGSILVDKADGPFAIVVLQDSGGSAVACIYLTGYEPGIFLWLVLLAKSMDGYDQEEKGRVKSLHSTDFYINVGILPVLYLYSTYKTTKVKYRVHPHSCFCLAVLAFALSVPTAVAAQRKIGYINMDDLVAVMPETRQAQQTLKAYGDSLARVDDGLQQEFVTKRDAFFRDSATLNTATKEVHRRVLQKIIQQDGEFRAVAKTQLDSLQQVLTVAVAAKAQEAVAAAAKANGYAYVFRNVSVLVSPEGGDLLPLVKRQLGL